jgi:hypothetical protein
MGHALKLWEQLAQVVLDHRVGNLRVGLAPGSVVEHEDQDAIQHQDGERVLGLFRMAEVGDTPQSPGQHRPLRTQDTGVFGDGLASRLTFFLNTGIGAAAVGRFRRSAGGQALSLLLFTERLVLVFFLLCSALIASRPGRRLGLLTVQVSLGVGRNIADGANPPAGV